MWERQREAREREREITLLAPKVPITEVPVSAIPDLRSNYSMPETWTGLIQFTTKSDSVVEKCTELIHSPFRDWNVIYIWRWWFTVQEVVILRVIQGKRLSETWFICSSYSGNDALELLNRDALYWCTVHTENWFILNNSISSSKKRSYAKDMLISYLLINL